MFYIETCSFKINLNLRVLKKRDDGYHDIHSLFWRRRSPEVLEICTGVPQDRLRVEGARIPGENLLTKVCAFLRAHFGEEALPPVELALSKFLSMGGGLGAGSGNAAALLNWFERFTGYPMPDFSEIGRLGADVAFLASHAALALADGIGEELEPLDDSLELPGIILFPKWSSDTGAAYASLDSSRAASGFESITREEARFESFHILKQLKGHKPLGLLPNDFMTCHLDRVSCYNEAYAAFEKSGAIAWGLCGSGSCCFALYDTPNDLAAAISSSQFNFLWLHKIMAME